MRLVPEVSEESILAPGAAASNSLTHNIDDRR